MQGRDIFVSRLSYLKVHGSDKRDGLVLRGGSGEETGVPIPVPQGCKE